MTDAATAFVNKGARDNWPPLNNPPSYSIGFTLGAGSWPHQPGWDPKRATEKIVVWPNPAFGSVFDNPGRFGTIPEWRPKKATGWFLFDFLRQWKQTELDFAAMRTPLEIPWGPGFTGSGGTQSHAADNGVIVDLTKDGTLSYEIQGLARLDDDPASALMLNDLAIRHGLLLGLPAVAKVGHYRADAIARRAPGVRPVGSQGPWWKADGQLTPDHLSKPWTGPVRVVGFNVAYGPKATAAPGGWVEHRSPVPAYEGLPAADHPDLIPCWTLFKLDITDEQIAAWVAAENVDALLGQSMANFARGLRTQGMRLAESGTGFPFIESTGGVVPAERSAWAARGITSEHVANRLGHRLFAYGKLYAA